MTSINPHTYLNTFVDYESRLQTLQLEDFNLNRIHQLLGLLNNPQKELKVIHVAGTKGKGSTCAFIASILHQAHYTVGLFTSPHLHKVNERVRLLNTGNLNSKEQFSGCISDDELSEVLAFIRPHIAKIINEGGYLTYFEVLTVVAIVYFVWKKVDLVILETGLGGRLDATNVTDAMITVLTPISLDHTRILGPTLEKIAIEKSAIIKHSYQRVVVAPQENEAMSVITLRCQEFGVQPIMVIPESYKDLKTALKGEHQCVNAAVALNVIKILQENGYKIDEEAVNEGLKNVRWSGRFEVIQEKPTVVVDCAHNAASAKALARTIMDVYPYRRIVLVLGVSTDKDVSKICEHLRNSASQIILTEANHPRAHHFQEGEAKIYFGDQPWAIQLDLSKALDVALKSAAQDDVILITGSVFVVAQAMEILLDHF